MHYVIIGNGVAGINAANTIRNRDEHARISIVSSESDHFFSRTALMYVFCGQLSEQCVEPYERDYYQRMRFERYRKRVIAIDHEAKALTFSDGGTLNYDRLLIASGSVGRMADWPGGDLPEVGHFVTWQDLEWLQKTANGARRAVVVGGGLIGIETVEILLHAGIDVTFLVREEYFWPIALDRAESEIVMAHTRHHGCNLKTHTAMEEILGRDGHVVGVRTAEGEVINCDLVVVTIGVRPQTDWLTNSGIARDEHGGIIVDEHLRTNLPDIWAAGDCTSVVWFNGVRRPEQLWYTSRDQGLAVGRNLSGDNMTYERGIFYNSAKFFDIEYTTAGLVNFHFDNEQNRFYPEPGTNNTIRIVYLPDQTVIGFNMLGRRWDHSVLVRWIEQKRKLDWVWAHLSEANFDEELMPKFRIVSEVS